MSTSTVLKAIGIVLICAALHDGFGSFPWLVVFGAGLGFLFLP